jgi:hypothetical protein
MKGLGDEEPTKVPQANFFVQFGCLPEKGVAAKSNLAAAVIKCVTAHLNRTAGVLDIQEALKFIKHDVPTATKRDEVSQSMYLDTNLFTKVKSNENETLGEE